MFQKRIKLGLIHLAVAMTLVPINSTLNRVMIKELSISATLVAIVASLPYLVSPVQILIGSYSDTHPLFGYHRSPYILVGLVLCAAGVVISPQVAFMIGDHFWSGVLIAVLAFGAWGIGYNLAAVAYLSLASEISGEGERGKTVAVMWVMMIIGIILTALTLSHLVDPYTEEALHRAFWIIGGTALGLGLIGLFRLERRGRFSPSRSEKRYPWSLMVRNIFSNSQARVFFIYLVLLLAALLGQDILLEPFAAEAFDLSVKQTTQITSLWGVFVLVALAFTGLLENKFNKKTTAALGGALAFLGFSAITASGAFNLQTVFYSGVVMLGIGTGMSTVTNLSLMMDMTIGGKVGMFIGAWGMANAISRLIGSVLAGAGRDILAELTGDVVIAYVVVFGIMTLFMMITIVMLKWINIHEFQQKSDTISLVERAAIAGDV